MKFLGSGEKNSPLVLIGAPWECPSAFREGTTWAPDMIRWASESIEEYSIYARSPLPPFNDLGNLELEGADVEEALKKIEESVCNLLLEGKKVVLLGGNHTVSLGSITAYFKRYPELRVIHLDAHLDRRDEYKGGKINYATVIRRVEELIGRERVYSFGIRSIDSERATLKANVFEFDIFIPLNNLINKLSAHPLYLTFDFDVLDPSVFPAVTNPVPGGVGFKEVLESIKLLAPYLVGADFVEYNPKVEPTGNAGITAAVLIRELLILWGKYRMEQNNNSKFKTL